MATESNESSEEGQLQFEQGDVILVLADTQEVNLSLSLFLCVCAHVCVCSQRAYLALHHAAAHIEDDTLPVNV